MSPKIYTRVEQIFLYKTGLSLKSDVAVPFLKGKNIAKKLFFLFRVGAGLVLVCSTSPMASLLRSVGGLSKYFYQGLWLANQNADVIGQSINKRGVSWDFPHHVTVSSSFSARLLYGFPYRFQRAWTVLWSSIVKTIYNVCLHGCISPS